ncbi:acetyltransferase [Shewanella hanedai]|uniref:DHH family phosphoesterase n=1 Tax=Shewanella hanedai TaxID=25 RepID=A0A553JMK4_SHEHA|nr:DHH family phosphoesterase [Shewanella hanedai]TRY13692.1 DHH family phosphoesterase [Shewanella hanedai]GGI98693.1 acetyltransferase [Shewanella hanedai]
MNYDVFNGDADGIIALLQLRLNEPKKAQLITGVKRDNNLLKHVDIQQARSVVALDISMEKNTQALQAILANDIEVFYCDHHRTGEVPVSAKLSLLVDTAPEVCTSLLINELLENRYIDWAITAAYGDNLVSRADELALQQGLTQSQSTFLCELGTLINYNGYGASLADLHFDPAVLYQALLQYESPFAVEADEESVFYTLRQGYQADHQNVSQLVPFISNNTCEIYQLPCEGWARRISGVFGNELANRNPDKAHAVLTLNADGSYMVSVRAPLNNRTGADEVCVQFATGGGRKAAAGINQLPEVVINQFVDVLMSQYQN